MKFSIDEKNLIIEINNNNVTDIYNIRDKLLKQYIDTHKFGNNTYWIAKNINLIINIFQRFLPVVSYLEKMGFIVFHKIQNQNYNFISESLIKGSPQNNSDLDTIIYPYRYLRFTPSPILKSFIENDFQTSEELKTSKENRQRNLISFITIFIAILSLIVSAWTAWRNSKNIQSDRIKNGINLLSDKGTIEGLYIIKTVYNDYEIENILIADLRIKFSNLFLSDKHKSSIAYDDLSHVYLTDNPHKLIKMFSEEIEKRKQNIITLKTNIYISRLAREILNNPKYIEYIMEHKNIAKNIESVIK